MSLHVGNKIFMIYPFILYSVFLFILKYLHKNNVWYNKNMVNATTISTREVIVMAGFAIVAKEGKAKR